MSLAKLRIMWCSIILAVVAILCMPRHEGIVQPVESKAMTPPRVEQIQGYIGLELFIVGIFMVGGAVSIHSAVRNASLNKVQDNQIEPAQKDAKPSVEEPLLVLTDERGQFVV